MMLQAICRLGTISTGNIFLNDCRVAVPYSHLLFLRHILLFEGIKEGPTMRSMIKAKGKQPILNRIHLDSLGSISYYKDLLLGLGFKGMKIVDHTEQLSNHYSRG